MAKKSTDKTPESFSAVEASHIAEVPYQTIDYWARSGFIIPSIADAGGRGTERRYAFSDLVALRTARTLRKAGASMQALRKVVNARGSMESSLSDSRVILVGKDIAVVSNCDEVMDLLKSPQQMVFPAFVFDRPAVVKAIRKRIKEQPMTPRAARAV
jgi:DNA-binding transcriptional MerR regulator